MILQRMDDRREIIGEHGFAGERQEIGHHQDARADTGVAQRDAFIGIADGEPARAMRFERSRNFMAPWR